MAVFRPVPPVDDDVVRRRMLGLRAEGEGTEASPAPQPRANAALERREDAQRVIVLDLRGWWTIPRALERYERAIEALDRLQGGLAVQGGAALRRGNDAGRRILARLMGSLHLLVPDARVLALAARRTSAQGARITISLIRRCGASLVVGLVVLAKAALQLAGESLRGLEHRGPSAQNSQLDFAPDKAGDRARQIGSNPASPPTDTSEALISVLQLELDRHRITVGKIVQCHDGFRVSGTTDGRSVSRFYSRHELLWLCEQLRVSEEQPEQREEQPAKDNTPKAWRLALAALVLASIVLVLWRAYAPENAFVVLDPSESTQAQWQNNLFSMWPAQNEIVRRDPVEDKEKWRWET